MKILHTAINESMLIKKETNRNHREKSALASRNKPSDPNHFGTLKNLALRSI